MRFRFIPLCLCALATLLFVAGCGRYDSSPFTAEIDEPNYRRGKDLLRQGRNPEALSSFLKVVEKRGDDAPESHLEIGILYQQHMKDPIAAIYHYRKFREVKRNSPQADLVRQRIDAATREFARTLPAQPLEGQMDKLELLDKLDQLQRENQQLKDQLAGVRTQSAVNATRPGGGVTYSNSPTSSNTGNPAPGYTPAGTDGGDSLNPVSIDMGNPITSLPDLPPPTPVPIPTPQPQVTTTVPTRPTPTPSPAASGRRYTVVKGDSLFAIARKHYGTGSKDRIQGILNANRGVLPNAGALQPGMTLVIPQ